MPPPPPQATPQPPSTGGVKNNYIVMAFPKEKQTFLDDFPLCPCFYCRLAVSD